MKPPEGLKPSGGYISYFITIILRVLLKLPAVSR
jgi:hypothetical protein